MHALSAPQSRQPTPRARLAQLAGLTVLLLPAALLLVGGLRAPGQPNVLLCLGAAVQIILVCWLGLLIQQGRRSPAPFVITIYILALAWLWLGTAPLEDWYPHLSQAILLVVPLVIFARQMLANSGASALRRAHVLAQRLAARKDWPADLSACKTLPDVKAFREALHIDASPALSLLNHPRSEVRMAALAALEFRQNWRRGQPELVLQVALRAAEPAIRAAAVTALANSDDRCLIETLAEFLRDPSWEVRRAATEALLWDTERRWAWIRYAVRRTLGDPAYQDDGPLRHEGQPLTAEAVADLTAWSAEKGILGMRAALTLGVHYGRALSETLDDDYLPRLRQQLANPHTPPFLRMELARLLQQSHNLDPELLSKLIDSANPAPLRLIALESLLADGNAHPEALTALHDLARLPNREIALAAAEVVQRRLGVDLGLAPGEALPPVHSRKAADVVRRVMLWASQKEVVSSQ